MRRHLFVAGFGAFALLVSLLTGEVRAQEPDSDLGNQQYEVLGPSNARQRSAVARTGAGIDEIRADSVVITAMPSEVEAIEALGYQVEPLVFTEVLPPGFEGYHDFAELNTVISQVVNDHPNIVRRSVIGTSHLGREIVAIKISDNPATDEAEPEVLFTHSQHAREILTVEMAIHLMNLFTDNYGSNARITNIVNSREIWIVPIVNPDGAEYDKTATSFRSWRKNRQPNPGSSNVGTDPNRNWNYQWGCCGGSSGNTGSETYRGASPESAPEVRVVANFVRSRVVGGTQQIKTHIDFHTFGELILWPYGYTFADTAPGLNATDRSAFATLGQRMAQSNGYTPQQASDLYIADGVVDDWMWGVHRIFSYTFEMFPRSGGGGFYPDDAFINRETTRNTEAVLTFLEFSDCPYRIINVTCGGGGGGTTVYSDNFEADTGWAVNASGTDTATTGQWQRGDPGGTTSGVTLQLGTTTSGTNDLVTGAAAGTSAGANDIDGGVTSVRSPTITLPATGTVTLSAQYYLAHLNNATNADFFRIRIVSGTTTTTVFEQRGAAANRSGSWGTASADLASFRGQTVRILVEAADADTGSLVEAGVDDVRITQQT